MRRGTEPVHRASQLTGACAGPGHEHGAEVLTVDGLEVLLEGAPHLVGLRTRHVERARQPLRVARGERRGSDHQDRRPGEYRSAVPYKEAIEALQGPSLRRAPSPTTSGSSARTIFTSAECPYWGMTAYPVDFSVEYPDRDLNRLTTALRIFTLVPILIVLGAIAGYTNQYSANGESATVVIGGTGLLFLPPLLLIVFRQKYPRWWFDWNLELLRFTNRVGAYAALMSDRYPSTDENQYVELGFPYPDARAGLNRWLPLVKWLLAIPHYIVLFFLYIAVVIAVIAAWFAILFTGRYPRGIFDYVEGVLRWHNRVVAYALVLVTDEYPPFRLRP